MNYVRFFRKVLFGSSIICLVLSIGFALRTFLFIHTSSRAQGEIVSLDALIDPNSGETNFFPVFSFLTQDGKMITVRSLVGSNPPSLSPGQHVAVLYSKANAEGAKLDNFSQLWFLSLCLVVIGVAHAIIAFGLWKFEQRRSRRSVAV